MEGRTRKSAPKDIKNLLTFETILHGGSMGKVYIGRRQKDGQMDFTPCSRREIQFRMDNGLLDGATDIYMTVNTFFGDSRDRDHVKRLCAQFVDIDCEKCGLTAEQVFQRLKLDIFSNNILPTPSITLFSGRGLHLYWLLADEDRNALPSWELIQKNIYEVLKEYGADPSALDAARILRLPFSINSANGKAAFVREYNNIEYSIKEWMNERNIRNPVSLQKRRGSRKPSEKQVAAVAKIAKARGEEVPVLLTDADADAYIRESLSKLPQRGKCPAKPQKSVVCKESPIRELFGYVGSARLGDLETLAQLRKGEGGHRECILFLATMWFFWGCGDEEKTWEYILWLNRIFEHPLDQKEITKNFRVIMRKLLKGGGYEYRDSKIVTFLQITSEEQQHLGYFTKERAEAWASGRKLDKKTQDAARYQRKLKAQGKLPKQKMLEAQLSALSSYLEKGGMTVEAICREMGISRSTFYRLKNKLGNKAIASGEKIETPVAAAEEPVSAAPKFVIDATTEAGNAGRLSLPCPQTETENMSTVVAQAPASSSVVSHNSVSLFSPVLYLAPYGGRIELQPIYKPITSLHRVSSKLITAGNLKFSSYYTTPVILDDSITWIDNCCPGKQNFSWEGRKQRDPNPGATDLLGESKTRAESSPSAQRSSGPVAIVLAKQEGCYQPAGASGPPSHQETGRSLNSGRLWLLTAPEGSRCHPGPAFQTRRQGRDPPNITSRSWGQPLGLSSAFTTPEGTGPPGS